MTAPPCPVCASTRTIHATAQVLGRHEATYARCGTCGFLGVVEPHWLDEAYAEAISSRDTGILQRLLACAAVTETLLLTRYDCSAAFVDYGGGYGLFTRLMRDRGFDFRHSDPYCANLFAQGHEWDGTTRATLTTAFEVAEHLPDPVAGLAEVLEHTDDLLLSTELLPDRVPQPDAWWYFDTVSGQHVSFYTRDSLQRLATRFDRHLVSNGVNMHLLSRRPLPARALGLACDSRVQRLAPRLLRGRKAQRTLLQADAAELLAPGTRESP